MHSLRLDKLEPTVYKHVHVCTNIHQKCRWVFVCTKRILNAYTVNKYSTCTCRHINKTVYIVCASAAHRSIQIWECHEEEGNKTRGTSFFYPPCKWVVNFDTVGGFDNVSLGQNVFLYTSIECITMHMSKPNMHIQCTFTVSHNYMWFTFLETGC